MKDSTQEAILSAVVLHIAAAAILFVLSLLAALRFEEPPVVLELVDLSPDGPREAGPPAPREPLPLEPEVEPAPARELPSLVVPSFAPVTPPPEVPPAPEPAPAPPPVARPTPPRPTPPPPPRATWNPQYQQRNATPTPPRNQPRPVNVPTIDTDIRSDLEQSLSTPRLQNSASYTAAERDELERYVAGIQARLQAAFRSVGPPGLVARVEFEVLPNGTFQNYRVVRSSGDTAFDQAALAAFQRVARYRPTPDGKLKRWTIDFRSVL
jgi:TonB family protein